MRHEHLGKSRDPYKENRPKDRGEKHLVERETQRPDHEQRTDHYDEIVPGKVDTGQAQQSRSKKWQKLRPKGTGVTNLGRELIRAYPGPRMTLAEWREQQRQKRLAKTRRMIESPPKESKAFGGFDGGFPIDFNLDNGD